MSSVSDTSPEGAWRRRGGCGRLGWTPFEVAAVLLGFMVYWPIGLGFIALKLYRRRNAFGDAWFGAMRDKVQGFATGMGGPAPHWGGYDHSGNAAFDEWRKSEIERLEAERRKLEAAQKEFAEFVAEARRARDREEFERFMRSRPQPQG